MNTLGQLNKTLLPALELTGIRKGEYLIVGSAGEFIGGYVNKFGDVDILVNPETFQRLVDNNFVWYSADEMNTTVRIIRIGLLDIIEHHGDWLKAEKDSTYSLPVLKYYDLVEWRIQMGRPKDQLKAWQFVDLGKISSWTLLIIVSIIIVIELQRYFSKKIKVKNIIKN